MAEDKKTAGTIGWVDLTVENADQIRDFYAEVAGWKVHLISMGDYNDYCMIPKDGETPVAGICHARGKNAALPPQWLIYITVDNLDRAVKACLDGGGKIITESGSMEDGSRYCAIEDPSGAAVSLFEKGSE